MNLSRFRKLLGLAVVAGAVGIPYHGHTYTITQARAFEAEQIHYQIDGGLPLRLSRLNNLDNTCPLATVADDRLVAVWRILPRDGRRPYLEYANYDEAHNIWSEGPVPNTAGAGCPMSLHAERGLVVEFTYDGEPGSWFVWLWGGVWWPPQDSYPQLIRMWLPTI